MAILAYYKNSITFVCNKTITITKMRSLSTIMK